MEELLTAIWPEWQEYSVVPLILYGITILATVIKTPKEGANPLYVIIYRIIGFIAMNIGDAKNADDVAAGRSLNYDKKNTTKTLLILAMSASLLTAGCALKELEPHEKGIAIAQELTETYYVLEDQYFRLAPGTQKQIAPMLDKYRLSLVLLRDAASTWYKTKTQPVEFNTIVMQINQLVTDMKCIISHNSASLPDKYKTTKNVADKITKMCLISHKIE